MRSFGGVKGGYDNDTLNGLADLTKRFKVEITVVESNFGDGAFTQMLKPIFAAKGCSTGFEEVRAVNQKEVRIIRTLEPLMNQHRLIFDRKQLENDFGGRAVYSLTYQMTHISMEKNSLQHDDKLDALELGVAHMMEWLDVNDEDGAERYIDEALAAELEKIEEIGIKLFGYGEGIHRDESFISEF